MNAVLGSPAVVETLFHYHTRPYPHPSIKAPAIAETTRILLECGAIEKDADKSNEYRTTEMGKAWVKAICDTPMPKRAYVDSHGKVIETLQP